LPPTLSLTMLPSAHPDFFHRPPPEGQSRESTILLDAAGQFWHAGERVEHRGMQDAFATWIGRHPENGRYVLCNGYDWSYFEVEDVPFFVRGLRRNADQLHVELSDRSEEPLAPDTLRVGARDALYCRVKAGRFDARFTPSAQAALLPYVTETASGQLALELGQQIYRIGGAE
jgi:hypothetical protein